MKNDASTKGVGDGDVVQCTGCGTQYRLTARKLIVRDSDRLCCDMCGSEIHKWSEAKVWTATRLKKGIDQL